MKKIIIIGMMSVCWMARAEVVYIDIGSAGGSVPSSYGAAYGTSGVWNTVTTQSMNNLVNSSGLATDVDMTISSPGSVEMTGHSATTLDSGLLQLVTDNFWVSSTTWTIALTGLAGSLYDVYVYAPTHSAVFTGDFTVNGTAVSSVTGSTLNTLVEGNNYARIGNVSVSGGTLTLASTSSSGYSGVAGLQIVAIPEPATAMILALGGGLIALYRRFFGRV